ncbi:MAG TPA: hypothetical protein VMM13_01220, partial [Euzebya sp.]|nr:hypothetical protein [Euzebya sp.]
MPTPPTDRARDLLSALEILSRHRNDDPAAYRAVHAATTAALDAVHQAMLDPRGGDLEAGLKAYGELAAQLRALPRPSTGPPHGRVGTDPLTALLGRRFGGGGAAVESWMSEVASGISPNL